MRNLHTSSCTKIKVQTRETNKRKAHHTGEYFSIGIICLSPRRTHFSSTRYPLIEAANFGEKLPRPSISLGGLASRLMQKEWRIGIQRSQTEPITLQLFWHHTLHSKIKAERGKKKGKSDGWKIAETSGSEEERLRKRRRRSETRRLREKFATVWESE